MSTIPFQYSFSSSSGIDKGKTRESNQDRLIYYPTIGFFGVSDGMGGMPKGDETADRISKELPGIIMELIHDNKDKQLTPKKLGEILKNKITEYSDRLAVEVNNGRMYQAGATISCVLLAGKSAIFVSLGDSRGYIINNGTNTLRQVTEDHNLAAEFVRTGQLTKEEARKHSSSSKLKQYMGMNPPARPDCFIENVSPGDIILVCSDGLHGMLSDKQLEKLLISNKNPDTICDACIDAANKAGGKDNISVVYIRIDK